jgi:hypothetical protein
MSIGYLRPTLQFQNDSIVHQQSFSKNEQADWCPLATTEADVC